MANPYTAPSPGFHSHLAGKNGVVLPEAEADGSIVGLGVMVDVPTPAIFYDTEKGGYFDAKTGKAIVPPDHQDIPFSKEPARPAPAPVVEAVKPAATKSRRKTSKTAPVEVPSERLQPAVIVKVHAGGVILPVTYVAALVDAGREMVVLVSAIDNASIPAFGLFNEVGTIKLTIGDVTYDCANVDIEYVLNGLRHQVLLTGK